jgi:hypothetical protein
MPYVKKDSDNRIIAVSEVAADGFVEVAQDDQQLSGFLNSIDGNYHQLASTDLNFIRVLEDVIELLISKNNIRFTDLPQAAQEKMINRQQLRDTMNNQLDLLDNEGEDLF